MLNIIDEFLPSMAPLSTQIGALPVLNRPLAEVMPDRLAFCRDGWWQMAFWPDEALLEALRAHPEGWRVVTESGRQIGESGNGHAQLRFSGIQLRYPWDLLALNETLVGNLTSSQLDGNVRNPVNLDGNVRLGRGSILLPGVYIEGNAVIGEDCKIGPNCYIRGNTVIGNRCHIGQGVEVKNSVLMDQVSAGHLSYIGDSVVGNRVNFGAGTILSNFRHDGKNHRSMVGAELLDTGRRKFGAIIGNDVHTGIHSSLYPGRKLWPGVQTLPGEIVKYDRGSPSRDA